jgi:hypothetical protein
MNIIKTVNRQPMECGEILASHVYDKSLQCRIHNDHWQFNNQKANIHLKNNNTSEQILHQRHTNK